MDIHVEKIPAVSVVYMRRVGAYGEGYLPMGTYLICRIPHTSKDVQCFWGSMGNIVANEEKQLDENRPILERYQLSLVENGYCEFCIPIVA